MAHTQTYRDTRQQRAPKRRGAGGVFLAFLAGAIMVMALAIGWAVYSGKTPDLSRDRVEIPAIRAPSLPTVPNPQPLPMPSPARPG